MFQPLSYRFSLSIFSTTLCVTLCSSRSLVFYISLSSLRAEIPCIRYLTKEVERENIYGRETMEDEVQEREREREWPVTVPQTKPNEEK